MKDNTEHVNIIEVTDSELKALNDMVRSSKVTATTEEILLIRLGRSSSPVLDVTLKVGSLYENRMREIENPTPESSEEEPTAE